MNRIATELIIAKYQNETFASGSTTEVSLKKIHCLQYIVYYSIDIVLSI